MPGHANRHPPSVVRPQHPAARLSLALVCGLLAGCAQQNPAITAMPSKAELPKLEPVQRRTQAAVTAEGRGTESRFHLVPDFKEPELTAEEKAVLGLDKLHYKFLPYNELSRPAGSRVSNEYAGVSTATDRRVHVWSFYDPHGRLTGVAGRAGGTTGVDVSGSPVVGTYRPREAAALVGPASGVVVETDNASSLVAERQPRDGP